MDIIEFKIDSTTEYPTIKIIINQRDLISMVKDYEMPFARAEGHPDIAGGYMGLSPDLALPPSTHFFGEPDQGYFSFYERTTILVCGGCGEDGCWPLVVKIKSSETTVIWQEFLQPHRSNSWLYDSFGPFVFDRNQYEAALAKAAKEIGN